MKVVCGANVPRVQKFHGTKVLGTFAPEERKFQWCDSSMKRKFLDFLLPGANVEQNESSTGAKVLAMDFSLPGTKVQRNEKARYRIVLWFLLITSGLPSRT